MATSLTHDVLRAEMLTIVSAYDMVNARQVREMLRLRWDEISVYLENGTILFIMGIHGSKDGTLGDQVENIQTMKNQVRTSYQWSLHNLDGISKTFQFQIPDMKRISEEMEAKNITTEFIDVWDYIKDEATKEIDKTGLIKAVRMVNANMIFLVICYSSNLNLRFLLEDSGLLSEIKMNREICVQSRGKILTMSKVQKEFLQTMAKPKNITKRFVQIQGHVGSGKTLLGIEVMKMKVANYLQKHGLNAEQGKEQIRVIIVIEHGNSNNLKTHLEKELSEDIANQAALEVHNNSFTYGSSLEKIIETPKHFAKFKETIILVDECRINRLGNYTVTDLDETLKIDYIRCIKYRDLEMKSPTLEETVQVGAEGIFVTLLQRQRSSQAILEISYFMDRHRDNSFVIPDVPYFNNSFAGPKAQWVEVKDAKAFVKYAEENMAKFNGETMLIRGDRDKELPEISSLCSKLEWKYCHRFEVFGSESSVVIIYDFPEFQFEAFTRAKHNLLIVTLSDKRLEQNTKCFDAF